MGGTELLNLKYILIGTLPSDESRVLLKNLRGTERQVCEWKGVGGRMANQGVEFLNALTAFPSDESLLLSAAADELEAAMERGMATIWYLPEGGEELGASGADLYAEGLEEVDERLIVRVYERHHGIPWTILETERCIVREFSMDYLDALFELYAGEGMTDYIEPLYPYEEERRYQEAYIEHMYRFYGYGMWIVCEKETGELIGRVGIEHREELGGELELGYAIGRPYQRKGYATEVCRAVMRYAREEIGVSHMHCLIGEGNTVSEHLAEKLGFSYAKDMEISGKCMKKYVI